MTVCVSFAGRCCDYTVRDLKPRPTQTPLHCLSLCSQSRKPSLRFLSSLLTCSQRNRLRDKELKKKEKIRRGSLINTAGLIIHKRENDPLRSRKWNVLPILQVLYYHKHAPLWENNNNRMFVLHVYELFMFIPATSCHLHHILCPTCLFFVQSKTKQKMFEWLESHSEISVPTGYVVVNNVKLPQKSGFVHGCPSSHSSTADEGNEEHEKSRSVNFSARLKPAERERKKETSRESKAERLLMNFPHSLSLW